MSTYRALLVSETETGISISIDKQTMQELKENFVRIKVNYSSINFKDALALKQNGGILRSYPMIPGIDLAGIIVESKDANWSVGQRVLVTGFGLGVQFPGGFSEYQVVPSSWLVRIPETLSEKEAMIFGTAGFTAALAVQEMIKEIPDKEASIAITGASGGVASIAIALLHDMGYSQLTAITRKKESANWLTFLGVTAIISPEEVVSEKPKLLEKQLFSGLIDTVGGEGIKNLLPNMSYNGVVTLCGNAGGITIETNVLPFILRAVRMIGIDSVHVPIEERLSIWQLIASHKSITKNLLVDEVSLSDIPLQAEKLLTSHHQGRTIVRIGDHS